MFHTQTHSDIQTLTHTRMHSNIHSHTLTYTHTHMRIQTHICDNTTDVRPRSVLFGNNVWAYGSNKGPSCKSTRQTAIMANPKMRCLLIDKKDVMITNSFSCKAASLLMAIIPYCRTASSHRCTGPMHTHTHTHTQCHCILSCIYIKLWKFIPWNLAHTRKLKTGAELRENVGESKRRKGEQQQKKTWKQI